MIRSIHTKGYTRLVHVLAALAPGAGGLELEVALVEVDVRVVRLGHDGHGRRGGVGPPLRLRGRDALDAVHAALELQLGEDLWLQTIGVNTNRAAAKVMYFVRLGKKVRPGTLVI